VKNKKAPPTIISIKKAKLEKRPARWQTVVPDKFRKEKLLGQGGQGTVYLGTYEGVKVYHRGAVQAYLADLAAASAAWFTAEGGMAIWRWR